MRVILAATLAAIPLAAALPVAQQNAIVQQYCAVCHTDASMNGGLSLQHFDAARPDPQLAAMIVSKLGAKAMGASGQPLPDKAVQAEFEAAMREKSSGFDKWSVTQGPVLMASVVRQVPASAKEIPGGMDLYRLTLTCNPETRKGAMQVAWSPGTPEQGRVMSASADGGAPTTYKIEGTETMGNNGKLPDGKDVLSAHGAIDLAGPLPKRTLTVSNLFGDEKVDFSFSDLPKPARHTLSACYRR